MARCTVVIVGEVALACAILICYCEGSCSTDVLSRYPSGWPTQLDVGIYWFGQGDTSEKAAGVPTQLYDPSKKTLIYFHGWTGGNGGWTTQCKRITTRCDSNLCPQEDLLVERWLADGWNVGYFYWDQLADEECTRDAEQKVWFDRGEKGLRWKSYDTNTGEASYHNLDDGSMTVADLCVQAVGEAMGSFQGSTVRFVGHSIGAPLAARCADILHARKHPAAPKRLALLEPFFTQLHFDFIRCTSTPDFDPSVGHYIPEATAGIVKSLWENNRVPTEVYKSSVLTELDFLGAPDHALEGHSVLVHSDPAWCGGLGPITDKPLGEFGNLECKHCAPFPSYFLQYGHPAPTLVNMGQNVQGTVLVSCPTPSSTCTDDEIGKLAERQHILVGKQRWEQQTGFGTFTTSDDTFALTPEHFAVPASALLNASNVLYDRHRSASDFHQSTVQLKLGKWRSWWPVAATTAVLFVSAIGMFTYFTVLSVRRRYSAVVDGGGDVEAAASGTRDPVDASLLLTCEDGPRPA